MEERHSERERIISYLLAIYLWPLNILFDPQSGELQPVYDLIDSGPIRFEGSASETVRSILLDGKISESSDRLTAFHDKLHSGADGITFFMNEANSPVELGIAGLLAEIGPERWREATGRLRFSDFLRLTVCVIGYRGLYEGWRHNLPILYQHREVAPHEATIAFLEKLEETFSDFEGSDLGEYKLHGIVA